MNETLCWIYVATPGDPQFVYEVSGPIIGWWLDGIEDQLMEEPFDLADFPEGTGGILCRVWPDVDDNGTVRSWNIEPVMPLRIEMVPSEEELFKSAQQAVET